MVYFCSDFKLVSKLLKNKNIIVRNLHPHPYYPGAGGSSVLTVYALHAWHTYLSPTVGRSRHNPLLSPSPLWGCAKGEGVTPLG